MQRLQGLRRLRLAQSIKPESIHHSITLSTIQIPDNNVSQSSNHSTIRSYSSQRPAQDKTIGEKMLELTEAGRYTECLSLYERVLSKQSVITEIAAYNVLRSNYARNNPSVNDIFLELIAKCPVIGTPAIFNLVFESIAKENGITQNAQSDSKTNSYPTSQSLSFPSQEIAMLFELMKSHAVEPDYVTHLHLAHISYQYNRTKDADKHFEQFMQMRDKYMKDQSINESVYTGDPPSKVIRVAGYVPLFRTLIFWKRIEFASYVLKIIAGLNLDKPWMYGNLEKLKLARKHALHMISEKQLRVSGRPPPPSQAIVSPVKSIFRPKQDRLQSNPTNWAQSRSAPTMHLNIPHVVSIDNVLMDEPSIDQLINGHYDKYRAVCFCQPIDDHHAQLLIYYRHHDLENAISQLQHGWSSGVSFQSAYYDLIIVMLCITSSGRSAREKMDLVIQVIDQSTNQHQHLSLVPVMLALRALAQFEMPLPVNVNTSINQTDRLNVLNIAHHCETLFHQCLSILQSDHHSNNPSVPLLRELYLRSQVKHLECGESAHLSINLYSDDQSLVSSLTPNSFVCLIYYQILAPRRNIKEAYHLFASLTSLHAQVPEAAFYYLAMGEVIRHNASKAKLIHLRAMQQRYLEVSDYFHYAIVYAFSRATNEKDGNCFVSKDRLAAQAHFLSGLNTIIQTKPLNLSKSVTRLTLIGADLALSRFDQFPLDHLVDYCLDSMLARSSNHINDQSNNPPVFTVQVIMSLVVFALHSAHISHSRTIKLRQLVTQTIDNIPLLDAHEQEKQLIQALQLHSRIEACVGLKYSNTPHTLDQTINQSSELPVDQSVDQKESRDSQAASTRIQTMSALRHLPSESRVPFLTRCCESLLIHSLALSSISKMRDLPKDIISMLSSLLTERQIDHDPYLLAHLASFHVLIRSNNTPAVIQLADRSVSHRRHVQLGNMQDRSLNDFVTMVLRPNELSATDLDEMMHRLKLINLVYQSLLLTSHQRAALFGVPDQIIPNDDDNILATLQLPSENDNTNAVSIALQDFLASMKASREVDYNTLGLFVAWSSTLQATKWVHELLDLIHNVPVTLSEVERRLKFYRELSALTERGRVHVVWSKLVQSFLVFLPQAFSVINKNHEALLKDLLDTYFILFSASVRYCVRFNQWAQLNSMSMFPRCVDADGRVVQLPPKMITLMLMTRMKVALMKGKVRLFRQAARDTASWGYLVLNEVRSVHPSQVPLLCMENHFFPSAAELVQHMVESTNPISTNVTKFNPPNPATALMPRNPTLENMLDRLSPHSAMRHALLCIQTSFSDPSLLDNVNLPFIVGLIGELCETHYQDVRSMLKNSINQPTQVTGHSDYVLLDESLLIETLADALAYRAFTVIRAKCILRANDPEMDFYGTAIHDLPKKLASVQHFMFRSLDERRQKGLVELANSTLSSR